MAKPRISPTSGTSRMRRPGTRAVGVAVAALTLTAFAVGADLHLARVGRVDGFVGRSPTRWASAKPDRTGFPAGTTARDSAVASSSSSSTNGTFWAVLAILLLATLAILGFVTYNRRRVREPGAPAGPDESGGPGGSDWGAGAGGSAAEGGPGLQEAEADAARLLIETDDAVKAGEQELGLAVTQFGRDSAAQLNATLDAAKEISPRRSGCARASTTTRPLPGASATGSCVK